jgi:4-hydroxybenzoyl-CoA reductase subunit beta
MMRLPPFRYHAPESLTQAAQLLASEGPEAALLAGGTDLLPNMKRRQQTPRTLIALRGIAALRKRERADDGSLTLGAGLSLASLAADKELQRQFPALGQAAGKVASPHIQNTATLGGNLCVDTRCNYYNQTELWRSAIDFCMKKSGNICWVAPGSDTCLAVASSDTAPALIALGARVRLVSASGEREQPLIELYQNDGIHYLSKKREEILTAVHLPALAGWHSLYYKLRRRGSIDFPVLSVAVAVQLEGKSARVKQARLVLGTSASSPLLLPEAAAQLVGQPLGEPAFAQAIEAAAAQAGKAAHPLDNTDLGGAYRKRIAREVCLRALRSLRDQAAANQ